MEGERDLDEHPRCAAGGQQQDRVAAAHGRPGDGTQRRDPYGQVLELGEPPDRSEDPVVAKGAGRLLRELAGDVGPAVGDGGDPEPHERDHAHTRDQHPAHARHLDVGPDHEQPQERPNLGPPERGQHPQNQRPAEAAEQEQVDRGQYQRDEHRIRLRAEDVVHVVLEP